VRRRALAKVAGRVQQLADLGDPGFGELAVVLAVEGAHQRDSLQAEQVPQGVLVDHRSMVGGANQDGLLDIGGGDLISGVATRIE
jgi:hypothetical protein